MNYHSLQWRPLLLLSLLRMLHRRPQVLLVIVIF
jgi:hypothetical protein